jgi:hypothetical protein
MRRVRPTSSSPISMVACGWFLSVTITCLNSAGFLEKASADPHRGDARLRVVDDLVDVPGQGSRVWGDGSSVDVVERGIDRAAAYAAGEPVTAQSGSGRVGTGTAVNSTAGVRGGAGQVETVDRRLSPPKAG